MAYASPYMAYASGAAVAPHPHALPLLSRAVGVPMSPSVLVQNVDPRYAAMEAGNRANVLSGHAAATSTYAMDTRADAAQHASRAQQQQSAANAAAAAAAAAAAGHRGAAADVGRTHADVAAWTAERAAAAGEFNAAQAQLGVVGAAVRKAASRVVVQDTANAIAATRSASLEHIRNGALGEAAAREHRAAIAQAQAARLSDDHRAARAAVSNLRTEAVDRKTHASLAEAAAAAAERRRAQLVAGAAAAAAAAASASAVEQAANAALAAAEHEAHAAQAIAAQARAGAVATEAEARHRAHDLNYRMTDVAAAAQRADIEAKAASEAAVHLSRADRQAQAAHDAARVAYGGAAHARADLNRWSTAEARARAEAGAAHASIERASRFVAASHANHTRACSREAEARGEAIVAHSHASIQRMQQHNEEVALHGSQARAAAARVAEHSAHAASHVANIDAHTAHTHASLARPVYEPVPVQAPTASPSLELMSPAPARYMYQPPHTVPANAGGWPSAAGAANFMSPPVNARAVAPPQLARTAPRPAENPGFHHRGRSLSPPLPNQRQAYHDPRDHHGRDPRRSSLSQPRGRSGSSQSRRRPSSPRADSRSPPQGRRLNPSLAMRTHDSISPPRRRSGYSGSPVSAPSRSPPVTFAQPPMHPPTYHDRPASPRGFHSPPSQGDLPRYSQHEVIEAKRRVLGSRLML
ncbi:hypothetical protein DIPPA_32232 [Diplonema papillatum]|nr:hypothetical protein DIPPA_32232 [Diplonema papillatum]|eukprot:gene19338-29781_t